MERIRVVGIDARGFYDPNIRSLFTNLTLKLEDDRAFQVSSSPWDITGAIGALSDPEKLKALKEKEKRKAIWLLVMPIVKGTIRVKEMTIYQHPESIKGLVAEVHMEFKEAWGQWRETPPEMMFPSHAILLTLMVSDLKATPVYIDADLVRKQNKMMTYAN